MAGRNVTYLSEANMITCVLQTGLAEDVLDAAKKLWSPRSDYKLWPGNWYQRKNGTSWCNYR
jgi:hypothetical protein